MFGPRITTVFSSRWKALWWSASVLLLAYCSVPQPDDGAKKAAEKPETAHGSPWDMESK